MVRAYKVVKQLPDGSLVSALHGLLPPRLVHHYSTQEWTEARLGGLLVFRTLARARREAQQLGLHLKVYSCACEDMVPLPAGRGNPYSYASILKVWQTGHSVVDWPLGTLAFKRVKLLREVKS